MSNVFEILSVVFGLGIPLIMVVGSVVFLILKIIERQKEKEKESKNINKYKKY